jgi:thioredoxin-dependent peroxiredoxin
MRLPRLPLLLSALILGLSGAPLMAENLSVGDPAPDFELPGSDGNVYRLSNYEGEAVILAWFPKAYTRGCTIECKSLVENGHLLRQYQVRYFMASVDALETNKGFAAETEADFPLLSDESKATAKSYGVLNEFGVASRHNYYIGADGRILAIDRNVRPSTAAEDIAAMLEELGVPQRPAVADGGE